MSRVLRVFVVALFFAIPLFAQQPQFEVATIKQNKLGGQLSGAQHQPGGRLTITNMTLRTLITFAYQITGYQLVGGPGWTDRDTFDIVARLNGNPPTGQPLSGVPDASQIAMQSLLADRFKLKLHREMRELDVLALVLAKPGMPGPGLTPSTHDCQALVEQPRQGNAPPPCSILGSAGRITFDGYGMRQVADMLIGQSGRIVIDRTGLAGTWQFVLTFAPEGATDANAPSFFTALQEQLGLKLEPAKAPVEVTVIDAADRPTED